MKKLFKIMIALVLMLTFTFTITACNDEGKDVDPATLTVADVFQEVEMSTLNEKKNITYSQMTSKITINEGDAFVRYKCIASYDFEISKIIIKAKSSYSEHIIGDKFWIQIFDNPNMGGSSPTVAEKKVKFETSSDFNKEHTIEFTFATGEFVISKNNMVGVSCACKDKTETYSVEIVGKVIEE